jgi:hypothetical protein
VTYHHAVGAIEDTGLSPYDISGNPVTALVAQVNRFAGKTVKTAQSGNIEALKQGTTRIGCGDRVFLSSPLPLIPSIDPRGANIATLIVWTRYACSPLLMASASKEAWALNGTASPWTFVMNNLKELTVTIAQYADSLGLEPAKVGITKVDPKMTPKFPTMTVVILGALALAAVFVSRRRAS